jgi:hypothetical protein
LAEARGQRAGPEHRRHDHEAVAHCNFGIESVVRNDIPLYSKSRGTVARSVTVAQRLRPIKARPGPG